MGADMPVQDIYQCARRIRRCLYSIEVDLGDMENRITSAPAVGAEDSAQQVTRRFTVCDQGFGQAKIEDAFQAGHQFDPAQAIEA